MDLFEQKNIAPMLIGAEGEAFDSPDYLYELKLDGERAIAYLAPDGTELRNKRNKRMLSIFPELEALNRQVNGRCILDGEYVSLLDGKPCFADVQRRSLMSNSFRIKLAAEKNPISFVAFDLLYLDGKDLTGLPLVERKVLLQAAVTESERFAVSRFIKQSGTALYALAEQQGLEGIVAKRQNSHYYQGKRTKDWIKIKNLLDDDFVVCGYIPKSNHMTSIVLGQYEDGVMTYKGHATLGVSGVAFQQIQRQKRRSSPPLPVPKGHGNDLAVWVEPELVCTVKFMERTAGGGLRQPVFKGLRVDKLPRECLSPKA